MSWYYVDSGGNTQGPLTMDVLKQKYASGSMTSESYVWNGADVNQWTPAKNVASLMAQLKPQNIPGPPAPSGGGAAKGGGGGGGGSEAAPVKPARATGGRANLLSAIRAKPKLAHVDAPEDGGGSGGGESSSHGGGGGGGGAAAPKQASAAPSAAPSGGGGGKLSLQEQMAATLKARRAGGGAAVVPKVGGGAPSSPASSPVKKEEPPKSAVIPKSSNHTPSSSQAKAPMKFGNAKAEESKPSGDSRIDEIKAKLDSAEDWQIKAIEKILS
jgi:hypothetical protein